VPFDPEIEVPGLTFIIPKIGDKKKLLELCERNARYFMLDKQKQESWLIPKPAPTASWSR
jgi:excinuclease ABC subunit C